MGKDSHGRLLRLAAHIAADLPEDERQALAVLAMARRIILTPATCPALRGADVVRLGACPRDKAGN